MGIKDFFKKVDNDKLNEALASDNPEDMKRVAEEANMELSFEQLDFIAGGTNPNDFDSEERDEADSYGPRPSWLPPRNGR